MDVRQRLSALREQMREKGIDLYLIPSSDYHQSEYVGDYFKARQFMSGFTGTAGTVVVSQEKAGLWTDGRYYIQAEMQLADSGITLYRDGEEGVIKYEDYILAEIPEKGILGFDGKVVSAESGKNYESMLSAKNAGIDASHDLVGLIWEDRPALSDAPVFLLEECYAGESARSKLERLREKMRSLGAGIHILADLTEIAWLFNIRGGDVSSVPVALAYSAVTMDGVYLFIDDSKLDSEIKERLISLGLEIMPYDRIFTFAAGISGSEKVLLDPKLVNFALYQAVPADVHKIEESDPVILMKALKNPVELKNIRNAYIKDGIACTKFMYWLKKNAGRIAISEITAADTILAFRKQQEGFLQESFDTIAAYREHAAMMHYFATQGSEYAVTDADMLLVDSGGHYYEGTTDVTRTFILGAVSDEIKRHFTAVVSGMLSLSMARFLKGCLGENLDILARMPMWEMGIDYRCGTGHGVGYLLGVHEGPVSLRWRIGKTISQPLEAGMVLTNEPGIYIEGSHGIRMENQLVVQEAEKTVFGQFMEFETVTLVPIDLDGIIPEQIPAKQRAFLNAYHRRVYETIAPYLTEEERVWLREYTRDI